MILSQKDLHRERILLDFCDKNQGPAITGRNSVIAPGATTYRNEFCDASADLYQLYADAGIKSPLLRLALLFNERNILSCRGNDMTPTVVNYFYEKHLSKRLKEKKLQILQKIEKEVCPVCGKKKINLKAHIRALHSNT